MSRGYRGVVWAIWVVSLALAFTNAVNGLANSSGYQTGQPPIVTSLGVSLAFSTIGGLIAGRTGNLIGWLFLAVGTFFPLAGTMDAYAFHGLVVQPGSRPLAETAAVAANSAFMPAALALGMVFVLFPTGRPAGRRWRLVFRSSVACAALVIIGWTLRPGPINGPFNDYGVTIANPIGIPALRPVLAQALNVGIGGSLVGAALGISSLVARFRRAGAIERQQIKWLASVGVFCVVLFASLFPVPVVLGERASDIAWLVFFSVLTFGVPASVGIAILRYRLYDIDRIISRTLSYAIVTALLAAVFALVVLVPTAVVGRGGNTPDWMIAVATLAVAALFRPVRGRVQNAVDHRFNRRRFDAEHTVEAFAARLREQVDIDALGAELCAVVNTTMQPSGVSLWLARKP